MYAQILNDSVSEYPFDVNTLIASNPDVSFPSVLTDELLESYGVHRVSPVQAPAHDPWTQTVVELTPIYADFKWQQQWEVRQATQQQILDRRNELIAEYQELTQRRLDEFAQTRNYDGILSACTYATSPTPKFAAEGQYCVQQRDATWAALYTIMAEVDAGTRPIPADWAELEALLPVLTWPA